MAVVRVSHNATVSYQTQRCQPLEILNMESHSLLHYSPSPTPLINTIIDQAPK